MKPGDVYRRAAEFLESRPPDGGMGMCCAVDIILAAGGAMTSHRAAACSALEVFQPFPILMLYWGVQWSDDPQERRNCRVLALLFAAAMADAGDL